MTESLATTTTTTTTVPSATASIVDAVEMVAIVSGYTLMYGPVDGCVYAPHGQTETLYGEFGDAAAANCEKKNDGKLAAPQVPPRSILAYG
jgi:hypothetical protein